MYLNDIYMHMSYWGTEMYTDVCQINTGAMDLFLLFYFSG